MESTEERTGPQRQADALDALRERLERTQEAAERLAREATAAAARSATGRRTPPAGWEAPREGGSADLHGLLTLGEVVRGVVPRELQAQIAAVVRELLLALRALIDWYLERVESRRREPVEVQDIPIL
jgi:hypothetical protein